MTYDEMSGEDKRDFKGVVLDKDASVWVIDKDMMSNDVKELPDTFDSRRNVTKDTSAEKQWVCSRDSFLLPLEVLYNKDYVYDD